VKSTEIELTLETRDREHVSQLLRELETHGFAAHLLGASE
jgi:hypothetical protein